MKKLELLIPPPIYMFSFMGVMYLIDRYVSLPEFGNTGLAYFGLLLIILGAIFGSISFFKFYKAKTTADPTNPEKTQKLVSDGIYRYSRNPMYLVMTILLFGFSLYLGSTPLLIFIPLFVLLITRVQVIPEERIMLKKFDEEYINYKKHTSRWL